MDETILPHELQVLIDNSLKLAFDSLNTDMRITHTLRAIQLLEIQQEREGDDTKID